MCLRPKSINVQLPSRSGRPGQRQPYLIGQWDASDAILGKVPFLWAISARLLLAAGFLWPRSCARALRTGLSNEGNQTRGQSLDLSLALRCSFVSSAEAWISFLQDSRGSPLSRGSMPWQRLSPTRPVSDPEAMKPNRGYDLAT